MIYTVTKVTGVYEHRCKDSRNGLVRKAGRNPCDFLAWAHKQHLVRSVFGRVLARTNTAIQVAGLFPELKWPEPTSYVTPKLRVHGALYQRPTRYHFVIHKRRETIPYRTFLPLAR
jgi:hypothetical protein